MADQIDISKIPPDVLEAMLSLSGKAEEDAALAQQSKMGQMLSQRATQQYDRGPSAVGGIAGGLAQGLQGYMGGKSYADTNKTLETLGAQRKGNRGKWFDFAMGGGQQPQQPQQSQRMPSPYNPEDDYLFEN